MELIRATACCIIFLKIIKADGNDWPKYRHPDSHAHECYMCPPGYYKMRDCVISRDRSPQWPVCMPCPMIQFSQRWNTDGRCWDHAICERNHKEIYNGGSTGPRKCACTGSTLEDKDGSCVKGISVTEHENEIKKLETDCEAKLDAHTKQNSVAVPSCAPCPRRRSVAQSCPICESCPKVTAKCQEIIIGLCVMFGVLVIMLCVCISLLCKQRKRSKASASKKSPMSFPTPNSVPDAGQSSFDPESGRTVVLLPEVYPQNRHQTPRNSRGDEVKTEQTDRSADDPEMRHNDEKLQVELSDESETTKLLDDDTRERSFLKKCQRVKDNDNSTPEELIDHESEDSQQGGKQRNREMAHKDGKLQLKLPDESEATKCLDDALRIIENSLVKIGDADAIMRNVFMLSSRDCTRIIDENNSIIHKSIRAGFDKWIEKEGKNATIQNLLKSLRRMEKNAVADEIVKECKIEEEREPSSKGCRDKFDSVVKICERVLDVDDKLKEFFRSDLMLGGKVDQIWNDLGNQNGTALRKKEFIRGVLWKWRDKMGKEIATGEKLIELFTNAGWKNYADEIQDELSREVQDVSNGAREDRSDIQENSGASCLKALPINDGNSAGGTRAESGPTDPASVEHPSRHGEGTSISPSSSSQHPPLSSDSHGDSFEHRRVESGPTNGATGQSSPATPDTRGHSFLEECQQVKDNDNSTPDELIDNESEGPQQDGKQRN